MKTDRLAAETKYGIRSGVVFHALVLAGISVIVGVFYLSWFGQSGFGLSVWSAYGREVIGVTLQYYVLVWLFRTYADKWPYLLFGLLLYYWLTYSYYFITAILIYDYTGLDDFSGLANHLIRHRQQYWQTLFSVETLMRLVRFPILITIFPLLLLAIAEGYRRQLRNAQLQQQNAELELNYLKSQVNPHFLFNILNSIYALTEEENPRAARLVAQLSGLMRYALYETTEPLVSLTRELAFIRDYIALEQTRTARRLTLSLDLPTDVDESLAIAPFILVTFVENAFKHGVAATTQKAWVKLVVHIDQNTLIMHVSNSRPNVAPTSAGGVGLSNVRKRLSLLYPEQHMLTINEQVDSYQVELQIQLRQIGNGTSAMPTSPVGRSHVKKP